MKPIGRHATGLPRVDLDIPATGHALVTAGKVDPACTADGKEAYYTCNNYQ